ncbi:MAG: iron-sulfur cluster repair di-iron protein [Kofleriaceae bacterium]
MNASTTLADLARTQPSSTRVFMRHKLDFCCGGRRSLADACSSRGLDAGSILQELASEANRGDDTPRWETRTQAELADHIESYYHAALRKDLPPLIDAARKVERVHADKAGVPAGLADVLVEFFTEMQEHMRKEEAILFPMLRRGARGEGVYMPVRMMEHEHDTHREHLARIRALTSDLVLPPHACATWTALYHGLEHVEAELMQHIHLENNILFSRATREG